MKKIFLFALTCMISYLSLATECDTSYCKGGQRNCCMMSNGDIYYTGGDTSTID